MTMTIDLIAAKRFLEEMGDGRNVTPVLCAVSGGLDSMCLLHLLSTWGRERNLAVTAAHFNHQLRGEASDRDEQFVRDWCAAHDVPFVSGHADVAALAAEESLSVEEAARKARYEFLAEQQRRGGHAFVLTAHHADDNAETMLLNLLRGTGTRGLAGIPEFRGCIARPFLRVTRQELEVYAEQHGIPHVEDDTNLDPDAAARNTIRLRVLPVLKELNPRAVENMTRAAELLAMDQQALTHHAERLLALGQVTPGEMAVLPLDVCKEQEAAVLQRAVYGMMAAVCGQEKDLTARHVEAVCGLLENESGKEVSLPYGMTARREEESLVVERSENVPQDVTIEIGGQISFGKWRVELSETEGDRALMLPPEAELTVTPWNREDRMTLPGSRGARSLKRLCADRGISPAQRELLPVLRVNGRAAAVPGIGVDTEFAAQEKRTAVFVTFYQEQEKEVEEKNYEK